MDRSAAGLRQYYVAVGEADAKLVRMALIGCIICSKLLKLLLQR